MSAKQILALALVAAVGAMYLGLSYFAAVLEHPSLLMLLVSIAPLLALALVSAWNSRFRLGALPLCAVCAALVYVNFDNLRGHVAWLYFAQHAGAMTLLTVTFGGTLGRGHADALCSRIAGLLLPTPLDADYARYTWKVTLAWTVYFALSALLSAALFFWGPIEAWSFFANVLTPILVGAMFVGEYAIRLRAMPGRAHFSIAQTIRAYRAHPRR